MKNTTSCAQCCFLPTICNWALVVAAMLVLPCARAEDGNAEEHKSEAGYVEPILTEETMPNEAGELSLRLSTDYRRLGGEAIGALPKVELFYGLAERLGAELSVPFAYHRGEGRTTYGVGDVSLGLKYLVLEHSPERPAIVFGLEAGFPTGNEDRELGEGAYEFEPFIALLKDFGAFSLQGNFGWSEQVNQEREDRFTYNWAFAVPLFERKVHLLAEINGDWGHTPQAAAAPGLKYNFTDEIFIGVAVPVGLNRHTPDWGMVTQFQIGF